MPDIKPLAAESLYNRCDLSALKFESTEELTELDQVAGQERALEALQFGVGIKRDGYNLFVMGPSGIGKCSTIRQYLEQQAKDAPAPDDWCYVNNFENAQKPKALRLPAGKGRKLREDIKELMEDLVTVLASAFGSDEYQMRSDEIEEDLGEHREKALRKLVEEAESHDIRLVRTPRGFSFEPMSNGKVLTPEQYAQLNEAKRSRIEEITAVLQEKLELIIREFHQWKRDARKKMRDLNRDVAQSAVEILIKDLKQEYGDIPAVGDYIDELGKDVIEHTYDFLAVSEDSASDGKVSTDAEIFGRYEINLIVDNSEQKGLPVIYEDSPTLDKLVGRIEHIAQMGTLITDFRLIKAGDLHKANGGFLIVDIVKILRQPFAWENLKRAITEHEIEIQTLGKMLSLITTVSLEPEAIPLDIKVVLLGERFLFYLLLEYDPEFPELFKIAADFENSMDRSEDNQAIYARLVATIVKREELRAFQRDAVERIIEHGSKLAQDSEKLSTHLLSITNLMCEADHFAGLDEKAQVGRDDVQRAIDAEIHRNDRLRTRAYEQVERGMHLIDTSGEAIGQVNGLSVLELGNFAFGQPFRITATTRLGSGEVVDIEREVELGGAIHSKGVMILSSFIGERYAKNHPLSLAASLVFEQSYGEVEGDSASVGELCALLSSLANKPILQWLAVTGSVNQHGQVQPIGGVNEKIEGFFDICSLRGLSGKQGVVIPESNVTHLMLRGDVIEAVKAEKFHIYPINSIDQAITLLTGIAAGELNEEGVYPEDSINGLVQARLEELARLRHDFGEPEEKEDKE
jgi:lon-related putative ATP-dependent protease